MSQGLLASGPCELLPQILHAIILLVQNNDDDDGDDNNNNN